MIYNGESVTEPLLLTQSTDVHCILAVPFRCVDALLTICSLIRDDVTLHCWQSRAQQ